jgi:hypothetical protein
MTLSFIDSTSGISASVPNIVINKPAGVAVGDLLVAFISGATNTQDLSIPAGWTEKFEVIGGATVSAATWCHFRIADGTEGASFTWTGSGNIKKVGAILCYRGIDPANPINLFGSNQIDGLALHNAPSLTMTVAGQYLVTWHAVRTDGGWTVHPPVGMTEREDVVAAGSGAIQAVASDELRAAAGATGVRQVSIPGSADGIASSIGILPLIGGFGYWLRRDRWGRGSCGLTKHV